MSLTKTQRRRRALRRVAHDLGVGGLFFYYRYCDRDHISCSSKLNTARMDLIRAPSTLRTLLTDGNVKYMYRNKTIKTDFSILFEDDSIEFDNIDELRRYLLIKRIAGI